MNLDKRSTQSSLLPIKPHQRLLLVHHVAMRTGYSRRMVRHLAQIGRLRGYKLGKKIWAFDLADVQDLGASMAGRDVHCGDRDRQEHASEGPDRRVQHPGQTMDGIAVGTSPPPDSDLPLPRLS